MYVVKMIHLRDIWVQDLVFDFKLVVRKLQSRRSWLLHTCLRNWLIGSGKKTGGKVEEKSWLALLQRCKLV